MSEYEGLQLLARPACPSNCLQALCIATSARWVAGSPARMTIYSAHDTTVFSLLAALRATEQVELPGFTAHVVVELWDSHNSCQDSHDFSVRILYNHLPFDAPGAQSDAQLTVSPACKTGFCTLEDFVAGTKDSVRAPEDCERGSNGVSHLHEPEDKECCSEDVM